MALVGWGDNMNWLATLFLGRFVLCLALWMAALVSFVVFVVHVMVVWAIVMWLVGFLVSFVIVLGLMSYVSSYSTVALWCLGGWPIYVPLGIILAINNP
jgi:hypothetical protein